jgi:hypothetical protein
MDRAGVLPDFKGIMVHDHWKPYYKYTEITHAFNAIKLSPKASNKIRFKSLYLGI